MEENKQNIFFCNMLISFVGWYFFFLLDSAYWLTTNCFFGLAGNPIGDL